MANPTENHRTAMIQRAIYHNAYHQAPKNGYNQERNLDEEQFQIRYQNDSSNDRTITLSIKQVTRTSELGQEKITEFGKVRVAQVAYSNEW